MRIVKILVLVFIINCALADEECKDIASKSLLMRLEKHVFCGYDDSESPNKKDGNATVVAMGMIPRIANFNEENDNLEIQAVVYMTWADHRLSWDPVLFDNATILHIPAWRVWSPYVENHGKGGGNVGGSVSQCAVQHSGRVYCLPMLSYTVRCQTDFTLWPFDRQNCSLVLGTWSYTGNEIEFDEGMELPVHMDYFLMKNEWRMVVTRAVYEKKAARYFENRTTSTLTADFILDRVNDHSSTIYVTPGTILMLLTLVTLWLDPRSIERMSLAFVNLILHILCVSNLHWALPHNGSAIPNILIYYMNSFVLAFIALLLTIILRQMQNLKRSPPKWISATSAVVLRSKIGQILLLAVLDPKASAGIEFEAEDTNDLVNSERKQPAWGYLSILISWLSFIIMFFVYVVLYAVFMPNAAMRAPLETQKFIFMH